MTFTFQLIFKTLALIRATFILTQNFRYTQWVQLHCLIRPLILIQHNFSWACCVVVRRFDQQRFGCGHGPLDVSDPRQFMQYSE